MVARRARIWVALAIVVLLGMAAGLRLYRLGMPDLWGDEILYLRMCHPGLSVTDTILEHTRSYSYIGHLPSTAVLTNLGLKALGVTGKHDIPPFKARLPSVLMGLVTLVLLAIWVYRMSNCLWTGIMCLALGSLSYLHIWYSREAYYYPGEVMYAVATCLAMWEAIKTKNNVGMSILYVTLACFAGVLVAFSHPTGALMPAVLAIYALVLAIGWERRNWRLYLLVALMLGIALTPLVMQGTGQSRSGNSRPWVYAFAETWHLLQFMTFGPKWWRGVAGLLLMLVGLWCVIRQGSRQEKLLLICIPILLLTIHSKRSYPYITRYFLLLWPFFTWVLARSIGLLIRRSAVSFRPLVFGCVCVAVTLCTVPGYTKMYAIEGKHDCQAMLRDQLDARLPEGAICVWDGGHALRFVPDFHPTKKPMLFGALPRAKKEDYEQGRVQQGLKRLADSFPSVAFLEWGGKTHNPGDDMLSPGTAFGVDVLEILPQHVGVLGRGYVELVRSGWFPPGGATLIPDSKEKREGGAAHAVQHLYYRVAAGEGTIQPVFRPGDWQLTFLPNNIPVVIGRRKSVMRLLVQDGASGPGYSVKVAVLAFVPGKLMCRNAKGNSFKIPFNNRGEGKEFLVSVGSSVSSDLVFEFTPASAWQTPQEPYFGILSVRTVAEERAQIQ